MAITGDRGLLVPGPSMNVARYGLLSVMQGPFTPDDVHWQAGLEFEEILCSDLGATVPSCPDPPDPKVPDDGPDFRMIDPFTVYGSYECSTGGRRASDAHRIARARLIANEHRKIEEIFWTGLADGEVIQPSLVDGDATITPVDLTPVSGALGVTAGLAVLESALAECVPGSGVIHANYGVGAFMASLMLLDKAGDAYFTPTGQQLALGAGYIGSGPGNVAAPAGETWLFATGPVIGWRGEIFDTPETIPEAVDRTLNNITVFSERTWAVGFSCCLLAVRVVLSCECFPAVTS